MPVQKDKVIEFTKRLVINAASQALNLAAPVQFAMDVARDFHDVFITADEEDRTALIESARSLSNAERVALIAEIRRVQGEAAANATRGVLETLRVGPSRHQALQTINSQMLGGTGQTLTPRPLSAQQRLLGSAVASFMMGGATHTSGTVTLSRSDWPTVPGYELTDFLGSGSFANVFLAHEPGQSHQFDRENKTLIR